MNKLLLVALPLVFVAFLGSSVKAAEPAAPTYRCSVLKAEAGVPEGSFPILLNLQGEEMIIRAQGGEVKGVLDRTDRSLEPYANYRGFAYYDTEWATWIAIDENLQAGKKSGELIMHSDGGSFTRIYACRP